MDTPEIKQTQDLSENTGSKTARPPQFDLVGCPLLHIQGFSIVEGLVALGLMGVLAFIIQDVIRSTTKITKDAHEDTVAQSFESLLRGQLYENAANRLRTIATPYPATSVWSGGDFTIKSTGTTDFTAIGAAQNAVAQRFISTGTGAGNGTALLNVTPGCTPKIDATGKQVPSTTNGAQIGSGWCWDADDCRVTTPSPINGPGFGRIETRTPLNAMSALRLINNMNRINDVKSGGGADSVETYALPIWRACMNESIRGVINILNRYGTGESLGVINAAADRSQCLPLAGYQGYVPLPASTDPTNDFAKASLIKEGRMGFYRAELWNFTEQRRIACDDLERWLSAEVRGYRISYTLMWVRNKTLMAKTGVLDVYDRFR